MEEDYQSHATHYWKRKTGSERSDGTPHTKCHEEHRRYDSKKVERIEKMNCQYGIANRYEEIEVGEGRDEGHFHIIASAWRLTGWEERGCGLPS